MGEFDVVLSSTEQAICRFIADERQRNKRKGGIEDKRYSGSAKLDLLGFSAEMAFCKWGDVYPDFLIHNYSGGADAVDRRGRRVDVKWSSTEYLLAPRHKKKDQCDIFVLVKGDFPLFNMVGWMTEEELLDPRNVGEWFGKGKESYRIHKDNLRSMWSNTKKM